MADLEDVKWFAESVVPSFTVEAVESPLKPLVMGHGTSRKRKSMGIPEHVFHIFLMG